MQPGLGRHAVDQIIITRLLMQPHRKVTLTTQLTCYNCLYILRRDSGGTTTTSTTGTDRRASPREGRRARQGKGDIVVLLVIRASSGNMN